MGATPKKTHVAVFAFPFAAHTAALLSLTRRLAESAPDVAFSFFTTHKSNASSGPIANLKIHDVEDGVPEDYVFTGRPQEDIELFMRATPGNFHKALESVVKEEAMKVSCVLSDSFLWFAGQMAEDMGVPWISLWTSGALSLSAHYYTDLIRGTIGTRPDEVSARKDEVLSFIPGFSTFRVRDLPEGIVFGNLESLFSRLLHRMAQECPRAAVVVISTIDGLESKVHDDLKTKFQKCLPVGPLSLLAPLPTDINTNSCLTWLDTLAPASVAYISFGTVASSPPAELAALAEGLEASGTHFLWSLKDKMRESLPAGFLERTKGRGMVVPWAPQSKVLGHVAVGAFLTHFGWNSVIESIMGGVPMIGRPFFGDHRINGRMVSHVWEIGIEVEGGVLTRDGVVNGLDLLLHKEEGRRMREKVRSLKEIAKDALSENGSCTKNLNTLLKTIKEC